jgi:hypothetical protein
VEESVEEETTRLGPDDERTRDNVNGGWVQETTVHMRECRKHMLDDDEQRISKRYYTYDKPTYRPEGTVETIHEDDGQYTARREAYPNTFLVKYRNPERPDELPEASNFEGEGGY